MRYCRYAENKANSAAKELNATIINRKGAATNREIGFLLNSFNSVIVKATTIWPTPSVLTVFPSIQLTLFISIIVGLWLHSV